MDEMQNGRLREGLLTRSMTSSTSPFLQRLWQRASKVQVTGGCQTPPPVAVSQSARLLQSITLCGTVGTLLVTSHVISDVTGASTILAVLISSLIALVHGISRSESQEHGQRDLYRAAHATAGELAAFFVALGDLVAGSAVIAVTARVVGATLDQLTGGHVTQLVIRLVGLSSSVQLQPMASAVLMLATAIMALGLEFTSWMQSVMIISSVVATLCFITTAVFTTGHSHWASDPFLARGVIGLVEGYAVFSVSFCDAACDVGRKPAAPLSSRGVGISIGMLFFLYCNLASSAALVQSYHRVSDRSLPGLTGGVDIAVGSLALMALCLLLVALMSAQLSAVQQLHADRLLPASAVSSWLLSACSAAAAAMISTAHLLMLAALCVMFRVAVHLIRALHRRHAPEVSCLCAGRPESAEGDPHRSVYRLRHGLWTLTDRVSHGLAVTGRTDDDVTPLMSTNDVTPERDRTYDAISEYSDSESSASGYESDHSDDTDIDAIVAEYRSSNPQMSPELLFVPTAASSRRVSICLGLLTACSLTLAILLKAREYASDQPVFLILSIAIASLAICLVSVISRQPESVFESDRLLSCSWMQCTALVLVLAAVPVLLVWLWVDLLIIVTAGLLVYVFYGSRVSQSVTDSSECDDNELPLIGRRIVLWRH